VFREFVKFDLRLQLRSPLVWIAVTVFALLAFAASSSDAVRIGGSIGNVNRNAPYVIAQWFGILSVLGLFVVTAFIAQPLLRDPEMRTDELFFVTPLRKRDYVWGRWTAGLIASVAIYLGAALGMIVGVAVPWLDPERIGPFSLQPFAWSFAVLIVPNLIFMGALLALLAVVTRKLIGVYVGVIAFFVLWLVAQQLTSDVEYRSIGALIDPFGVSAFEQETRYWSANERNTNLPALAGSLLTNRVLWLCVSAVLIVIAHALFKPMREGTRARKLRRQAQTATLSAPVAQVAVVPRRAPVLDSNTHLAQFRHQFLFDLRGVLRSVPFLIILAFAVFNLGGALPFLDSMYGTSVHPVTSLMLQVIRSSYAFLLVLIVSYYGGELVWRERDAKLYEIADTLPVPNWVPLAAKTLALWSVVAIFLLIGAATTIVFQLLSGYTEIEPLTYLSGLSIVAVPFMLMAAAAIFLQVVSNNKFLGYLLFIVLFVAVQMLPTLDVEHNLLLFAGTPGAPYSDMNGYGHFLGGWVWFNVYWAALAAALLVIAAAFWPRGMPGDWRMRWRSAREVLRGGPRIALVGSLAIFVAVGVWIFYNTNVLNEYVPSHVREDRQAHYEKAYRQYKDLPQPTITTVRTEIDIYPRERRLVARGRYLLQNTHDTPLEAFHIQVNPEAVDVKLEVGDAELEMSDDLTGYRIYRLATSMAPGATREFEFDIEYRARGFTNDSEPGLVVYNGTFVNNGQVLPTFGYDDSLQLVDRAERRKRGLGDVPRMPKLEDEAARRYSFVGLNDWIDFEATVSTSADQIALAPGYLQREWEKDGRRYFHYKMDRPMMPFFCVLSANWQVERAKWGDVAIEVYYDKRHPYNVQRMIEATQKSLDYYTREFSPYQHRQVRILEFPGYRQFAQSFANTIPFSESIGFIANLEDPDDIDYVSYVTAHEVAHQWFGHQILPANVQGAAMLSESLSQYAALMVMEKEHGRDKMRRFLKYELDRYLSGRGSELIEEQPLMRVENQGYIHYAKGSLVFYRLREEIGETALNRAIARYLQDKAFQQPPYTTTLEFLDYLRAEAPPDKHALLDELFGEIVFYDNRVVDAKWQQRPDGQYEVTIEYAVAKSVSDGKGVETPRPMHDEIEIGVFARKPGAPESEEQVLYLERHRLEQPQGTITVVVASEPYDAGIDPYNKFIDRAPDDNRKRVTSTRS
jgi:ABC-2 type transport system permease protein